MTWRFIPPECGRGEWNMAVDEMLMASCANSKEPVIRFYTWASPAVTIGYAQKIKESVDLNRCLSMGIPVIRRLTGGRAVLHHLELTYSIIIPENYGKIPRSVAGSYEVIATCFVDGLKQIGIHAEATLPGRSTLGSGRNPSCFESLSVYEIHVNGRKLVGSAQVRKEGVMLQHGSILLDLDRNLYREVFGGGNLTATFTTVRQESTHLPDPHALISIFCRCFEKNLNIVIHTAGMGREEQKKARRLAVEKYGNPQWNERF